MSIRVDTASLITNAIVIGNRGLGVLGSAIPASGRDGPAAAYPSLSLPADANKEIRLQLLTFPSGQLEMTEATDLSYTGPVSSCTARLFVDGVAQVPDITIAFTDGSGNASVPVITGQPQAQTASVGSTATFSVTATGTPAPTYQWQKNGVAIPGANASTYTTPALINSDNSNVYTCVVTNSAGSATSNAVMLTIGAPAPQANGISLGVSLTGQLIFLA